MINLVGLTVSDICSRIPQKQYKRRVKMVTIKESSSKFDVDKLLEIAIEARERGDLQGALILFENCKKFAKDDQQYRDIQNHIGLTYFHDTKYKIAFIAWVEAEKESVENCDLHNEAVALRNLSRKELYPKEELSIARNYAEKALEIAKNLDRKDIVWFIHGLFDVINASEDIPEKDKKAKLVDLYNKEKKALFSVWKVSSKLEREVWLTGLLKDFSVIHNGVPKPVLKIGILVTKILKLKRREEQLERMITEINKN